MKILFLDTDGILNSNRTVVAFNGYPHSFSPEDLDRFDWVAVSLIKKLCEETGAYICLSSSWRLYFSAELCAKELGLPIIDKTPVLNSCRGKEIDEWLFNHPEVETYAIVDDIDAMLPNQKDYFVHVDERNGLSIQNYADLKSLLGDE